MFIILFGLGERDSSLFVVFLGLAVGVLQRLDRLILYRCPQFDFLRCPLSLRSPHPQPRAAPSRLLNQTSRKVWFHIAPARIFDIMDPLPFSVPFMARFGSSLVPRSLFAVCGVCGVGRLAGCCFSCRFGLNHISFISHCHPIGRFGIIVQW